MALKSGGMAAKFKSVDAQTAHRIVESGAHVVDVRDEEAFAAGHVEGADRVALGRVGSHSVGRADTVVAVCANGSRSKRAAKKLAKDGYQTYHLEGGLLEWQAAGLPLRSNNGSRPTII